MRVAIVNNVPFAVEAISRTLLRARNYAIAWIAFDGEEAIRQCRQDLPDLLLMDLFLPRMDGVAAIQQIMAQTPCPILVVTAAVNASTAKVFEALGAGALDAISTPVLEGEAAASGAAAFLMKMEMMSKLLQSAQLPAPRPEGPSRGPDARFPLVLMGASAGGPAALAVVLRALPRDFPAGIVIVQHLDAQFAPRLAEWLTQQGSLPARIAVAGDVPKPGLVLLASSNDHLAFAGDASLHYTADPAAYVYRPSVDVLFESAAAHWRDPLAAVLLTGMGRDGAKGLLKLKALGRLTIAQDRESSVVYGMPKAAAEINAASEVLPLHKIAPRLVTFAAQQCRDPQTKGK